MIEARHKSPRPPDSGCKAFQIETEAENANNKTISQHVRAEANSLIKTAFESRQRDKHTYLLYGARTDELLRLSPARPRQFLQLRQIYNSQRTLKVLALALAQPIGDRNELKLQTKHTINM